MNKSVGMRFAEATILITGGNSGIGRALAEALAARGARILITGRNPVSLRQTLDANPGMTGYPLDVSRAEELAAFAAMVVQRHPELNVVINNAGVMAKEDLLGPRNWEITERTVATNLLAPMRLTTALLPHLRSQAQGAVVTVSSGLAFVPRADTPTYGATKAAIHSWTQALRHQLRDTEIAVVEIVPPLVATNFAPGQTDNPNAMPLGEFISEAMDLLCASVTPDEVVVNRALPQRAAERTGGYQTLFRLINPS